MTPAVDKPVLPPVRQRAVVGSTIAIALLLAWVGSLVFWFTTFREVPIVWWLPLAVLWQTFLSTGLFITAHDAMHGSAAPGHRRLNRFLGAFSVGIYALFSYKRLQLYHGKHHAHPASGEDPDYHDHPPQRFLPWYCAFLTRYIQWYQLVGMALWFNGLRYLVGIKVEVLIVFWVLPLLLSTLQLFFFGTYLPHKPRNEAWEDRHNSFSNDYPEWLSLVTCYHFGYHLEHHRHPAAPWWCLPRVRRWYKQKQSPAESPQSL